MFADRYEGSSLLIISNLVLSDWGQVFRVQKWGTRATMEASLVQLVDNRLERGQLALDIGYALEQLSPERVGRGIPT